ncbi:glycosyltransferase [Flavobacterium sp. I3-2]|uniref:glycosyltransferase n=1 Tax=Flavobacterium sp. I3-2 TaxID=2748319 RepID=UPI0015A7A357|nr:glycosyltransferase [Flavobacterium sp. I3-2]
MNQNPLVTVICTCFNHQNFVIETLNSVLNQRYSNIEIIIIDDCSSDDSISVITTFLKNRPEIKFIQNQENLGNTKTFNKAAKLANGTFLVDLACDDILLPNCIEIQIEKFLNSDLETTGIVFGNSEHIDENGKYISDYFETNSNKKVIDKSLFQTNLNQLLQGGLVMNSVSAMINKSIFDKLNGYDESLAFEDLDFWIRVLENHQIIFIDEIITQKRDLKSSLGNQFFQKNETANRIDLSMNKIFSKVIDSNKKNKSVLKAVLKRIHYSIDNSFKNRKYKFVFLFGFQKLKVHYYLLFAK